MKRPCHIAAIATILVSFSCSTFSDEGHRRPHRSTPYVGVYQIAVTGVSFDPVRCPDASHPILFTASGTAQTSLGSGILAQSHCEGDTGDSFTRGVQTITFHDGFQLSGTYEGQLIATPTTPVDGLLMISGRYRNTGGTGFLGKAKGEGLSAGMVSIRTGVATIAVNGTL